MQITETITFEDNQNRKLVAEWSGLIKIAIWDQCDWRIQAYEDGALASLPQETEGETNSRYLATKRYRITDATVVKALLGVAKAQAEGKILSDGQVEIEPDEAALRIVQGHVYNDY